MYPLTLTASSAVRLCLKQFFSFLRRAKLYSVLKQEIGNNFKVNGLPQLLDLLKHNFKGKLQLMQLIDLFLLDLLACKIYEQTMEPLIIAIAVQRSHNALIDSLMESKRHLIT